MLIACYILYIIYKCYNLSFDDYIGLYWINEKGKKQKCFRGNFCKYIILIMYLNRRPKPKILISFLLYVFHFSSYFKVLNNSIFFIYNDKINYPVTVHRYIRYLTFN